MPAYALFPAVVASLLSLAAAAPAWGQPPKVEVRLTGLDEGMAQPVKESLSLTREQDHPLLTPYRVEVLHRRAPQEIREALQAFGYYQPVVKASLDESDERWEASYRVEAGPPVRIDRVELTITGPGGEDEAFDQWRKEYPLKAGDVFQHEAYENAKNTLLATTRENGYFEAELAEHRVRVRLPENTATITLRLTTGPRYRFGEVRFDEVPLRESLLRRFLPFAAGDPFHTDRVFELQHALADSDYFNRVDVIPLLEESKDQHVPIEVRLVMQKRTRYTFGLGYGTDTGPRITAGIERRWLNSRGHRASARVQASEILTQFAVDYRVPLERPTTDFLAYTADQTSEDTNVASRDTTRVGAAITRQLGAWQRTVSLNYEQERFDIADESDSATMLAPGIGWQRVQADDRIFPTHGWRLAVSARGASESVASSTDLIQGSLRFKHVTTAVGGRLISRVDAGASETSNFDKLPVSFRFFAGGDNSVRGYAYRSLGPENSDGDVIGGKHLLVGSVEYDRYWTERMGAAIFIDQGNAFSSTDYTLKQGVGAGLRYKLPFGLVRVDVAAAISESDDDWRLHISIGPDL